MFEKYIIVGVLIAGLFLYSAYLFFQNISSEQVFMNALTSIGIGSIAFIALVISTWEKNDSSIKFPVVLHYEAIKLEPFLILDESKITKSFPILPYGIDAINFANKARKVEGIPLINSEILGSDIYDEFIFYEVITTLSEIFSDHWDIERLDSLRTNQGSIESYAVGKSGNKNLVQINTDQIEFIFPKSYSFKLMNSYSKSNFKDIIILPPKTKIIPLEYSFGHKSFLIENNFSKTTVSIQRRIDEAGLYKLGRILGVPEEISNKFRSAYYFIEIDSKIFESKSNHDDIEKYKRWIKNIEDSLREKLDYDLYIQKIMEWKSYEQRNQ